MYVSTSYLNVKDGLYPRTTRSRPGRGLNKEDSQGTLVKVEYQLENPGSCLKIQVSLLFRCGETNSSGRTVVKR